MSRAGAAGDATPAPPVRASRRAVAAWCLYDWGNSAFPTVITTFVFAAYFTKGVAPDPVTGTAWWGWATSAAALAIALTSPVLGAVADHTGRRKPWIGTFTAIAVVAAAMMWFTAPQAEDAVWALVWLAIGSWAFELGMVFYNAMLPDLAPPSRIGRVSGWGWGLGYAGGLACLVVALFGLVQAEEPWFGLDKETAEHVRASALLVAGWFALFSLPLFFFTPDAPRSGLAPAEAARRGLAALWRTLRNIRDYADVARYLLGRMIYIDGLNTLFAFGGIYAAGTFGMAFDELIVFGIAMNVTAGIGAACFAWIDDWIGPKRTILIGLACLTALGIAVLVAPSKTWFWVFGLPLGIFVGPVQSASRSLMAHLAPREVRTEMFGLYALSGKATAFLGPALLAVVTDLADSQRAGMATIVVFFLVGGAILWGVPDRRAEKD